MPKKDHRVEAYIATSADFAKPILQHLRQLVHTGCPEVEETIKWQFPTFMHKGMLCIMAAFKQHCTFGFWKRALIMDQSPANEKKAEEAMGQLGRITCLSDLPSDKILMGYVKHAVRLNEQGVKVPRAPRPRGKVVLTIPSALTAAVKKNKKALETFENFSPSHQREYIEWLTEAKREETLAKRLATTIVWLAKGKPRNWKSANC